MASGSIRELEAGDILFREGEQGNCMYVLLDGVIELKKKVEGGETILRTINTPNDFFGEMALIDAQPRSASAVAPKRSRLLVVDGATFENMILTNGKFALTIIKALSTRLRASNQQVEDLIEMSPKERIKSGIAGFAAHTNNRIHDGGYKVSAADLRIWLNSRLGVPMDEVDAWMFKLLKDGIISWSATSTKTKEHLIIPDRLVKECVRFR
jgi:CRP-like cAMP-binding protein